MASNVVELKTTKKQREQLGEFYSWVEYYHNSPQQDIGLIIAQCCSPSDCNGVIKALFIEGRWAIQIIEILHNRHKERSILFRRFN